MQTLAFLWFELQAARRRLRETFAEDQVPAAGANSSTDAPSSVGPLEQEINEWAEWNQDGAQRDKTLLKVIMKKPKRTQSIAPYTLDAGSRFDPEGAGFIFLIQTAVCLAISAVVPRVGSSLFDKFPPATQAGPETNVSIIQREKAGAVQTIAQGMVSVVHPEKSGASTLQLPGQLSAYTDAPIYAQTSGYLKTWFFDIGAKVKANDILGEIDTPEVDQALAQAKAQLQVDQSALQLAQVTYRRYQLLFNQKVLDAQTRDNADDTYREDQARVAADRANIDRLNALEGFKLLRAPFDGIVTARDIDVGAYVANGSGDELFRVARTSPLRIYVNVPQVDAQLIKIGMEADLSLPQFPNRTFRAHVTNTAEVVDPSSRSLLTQLQIPNESGELLPGAYSEITFKFTDDSRFLTIPENSLLFRREGPAVGVVHPDGKVELRNITINRDFGDKLEVSEGLSTSDQVILNPSDSLTDGMSVRITEPGSLQPSSTSGTTTAERTKTGGY
jgi:RND family efflux transporter MFP subunit